MRTVSPNDGSLAFAGQEGFSLRVTSKAMPTIYVIGGPNGAGKSTAARMLLDRYLNCPEFVNADVIARGLSAFRPESVALKAGRLMLQRLDELAVTKG